MLAALPTGGGKSAIYQLAGALLPGATIVVSPLLALQRDQAGTQHTQRSDGAAIINSGMAAGAQRKAFADLASDTIEFVYLAPEQLHRPEVLAKLRAAAPSLFVALHFDVPASLGRYDQEFGRAGRDGEPVAATALSACKVAKAVTELEEQSLAEQAPDGELKFTEDDVDTAHAASLMQQRHARHRQRLYRELERDLLTRI